MIVTRFAPSPTGFLHIGGLRTALYAYLCAKNAGGKFILRFEDTDQKRLVKEGYDAISNALEIFDLKPDEVYKQSERLPIYKEYAEKLIANGYAYYCFATEEEIEKLRNDAQTQGVPFRFRSPYRDLDLKEAKKKIEVGAKYTIRLRLPENEDLFFEDQLQGKMKFNTDDTDEGVLLKTDGFPTYHLAFIVDDYLMGITHVFRGVEWIPSLPKHILIYRGLGLEIPKFYHLPLILDPEGGKLSKRKGAVAVHDFMNQGYLKEAILNFIALLGWTPKIERVFGEKEREFFSMQDMLDLFSASNLNKSSAVFNREKLLWFNQQYIQQLSADKLQHKFIDWMKTTKFDNPELTTKIIEKGPDFINKVIPLVQTRVRLLSEIPQSIEFFFNHIGNVDFSSVKQTKNLTKDQTKLLAKEFTEEFKKQKNDFDGYTHEMWEGFVRDLAEKNNFKAGEVFMAMRLMLTDTQFSPPLFEIVELLGRDEVIARLNAYL